MDIKLEHNTFRKRIKSMLAVDLRRMFTSRLLYIMVGACFVMPILILVMTTMMDGSVTVDPQTGVETVIEGFDNTWQIIGSVSGSEMAMDITGMCNINMLYFVICALVCIFVSGDFMSGYAKNIFSVRAKKTDYVISKTLVCFLGSVLMILAFVGGAMIGGAISGLSFEMTGFNTYNITMCIIAKCILTLVFVPIYLVMSVVAKQKLWLSILLSMMTGMFMFMMIPIITPLNSTVANIFLCLAGGVIFSIGLGAVSNAVLKRTNLV